MTYDMAVIRRIGLFGCVSKRRDCGIIAKRNKMSNQKSIEELQTEIAKMQAAIEKLQFENATLERHKKMALEESLNWHTQYLRVLGQVAYLDKKLEDRRKNGRVL